MTTTTGQFPESPVAAGPFLRPGDTGFDDEVRGFQAAYTHRPDLVVCARHAEDVRAAVEHAARHRLPVAVQATGHGLSAPLDGGVLISTRCMTELRVDPGTRTARVGAGVRAGALVEAAAAHGLAPLTGSSPSVGVVGYTLGGGLGLLARTFGYAADHVRAVELVTADGRLRRLVPGDELFGAVLGSVGNFGVVTALEMELVPVASVYGGQLTFDTRLVEPVLEAWRLWTTDLPEEMTSALTMLTVPDAPGVPVPLRGRRIATVHIAHVGPADDGEELVRPLRAVGPRLADDLCVMPFAESHAIYRDPEDPHAYLATNALLADLDADTAAAFVDATGPGAPVPCVASLRHLGGALTRPTPGRTVVEHRDARYLARVITEPGAAGRDQLAAAREPLSPSTVGHLLTFLYGGGPEGDGAADEPQVRAGFGAGTYERLAALKVRHDPQNLFRANRNIRPS